MLKRSLANIGVLFILACALIACTAVTVPPNKGFVTPPTQSSDQPVDITGDSPTIDSPAKVTIDGNLWDDMQDNLVLPDYSYKPEVKAQIRWYKKHQGYLNKILEQSAPYIYYIYQQTKIRNLPAELALIPIIESNYDPFAHSKVGAIGLWQMMPGTASGFGLKINWWYDGRRDLIASTKAALDYMAYLHDFFTNDWLQAIAAYDSGEGTVLNAVDYNKKHHKSTAFWSLRLPQETKIYVPKLLALASIIRDPYRYNINLLPINNAPYLEEVDIGSQIDLAQAAKLAGIKVSTMRLLNPGFRRWATDPDGPYALLVPADKAHGFKQRLDALPKSKRVTWRIHTVKHGETLGGIADKYKTKLYILKQVNHLPSNIIHPNQEILIPVNYRGSIRSPIIQQKATIAEERLPGPRRVIHVVKRHETLWTIAEKYGVKAKQICFWNHLNMRKVLSPTQHILIWAPAHRHYAGALEFTYRVKTGDNLFTIAKHYATSVKLIRQRNHLKTDLLHLGQVLKIPTTANKYYGHRYHTRHTRHHAKTIAHYIHKFHHKTRHHKSKPHHLAQKHHYRAQMKLHTKAKPARNRKYLYHIFKHGDSLTKIAHEFHTSVAKLRRWNHLPHNKKPRIGQRIYAYF